MGKKIKLIVFDFDGVLADSFDTFYPLMHDVMKHVGLSLTTDQYRSFFVGNVHQSIKDLVKDDKKYKVAMEFRNSNYDKYYYDERHKVKLFPEAPDFLKKISKNYILTIASSGQTNNITDLLERSGVKSLFSLIMANSANSKAGMITDILDKFQAVPEETIMLTDTVGDLKVAKKMGLKTIAVTWGFHGKKLLAKADPGSTVDNFQELLKVINGF